MARKATPKQKYIDAMSSMLDDGLRIEEITATKLQTIVGGQYSKIVKIVELFKDEYLEKQDVEKTAPLSPWFKDVVENITSSVSNQLTESWFTINNEISSSIAKASETFESQKAEFKAKALEDLEQIKVLEDENEKITSSFESAQEEVDAIRSRINLLIAEKKNKTEQLKELKADHKETIQELKQEIKALQTENISLNKSISNMEGQLTAKNEMLENQKKA